MQPEYYFDASLTNSTISQMLESLLMNATALGAVNASASIPPTYFAWGTQPPAGSGNETVSSLIANASASSNSTNQTSNVTLAMVQQQMVDLTNQVS
jgi:hypothetical protein